MKNNVIGILAHVDAGKTTLSESILYISGKIRKLGRVDHQDAFLDNFDLERKRGITIFSKQAVFRLGEQYITLLDTPGHVDFSAEMERTLQVLDYAVLVVNGMDGVQGHTQTLWKLLQRYQIPTFIFINKMDQTGLTREQLYQELRKKFGDGCVAFDVERDIEFYENIAMQDEAVLEEFFETETVSETMIGKLISQRKIFPCYFGSALKVQGVEEFLESLEYYLGLDTKPIQREEPFGARVFKISRDQQGNRLTHMKVTSGVLKVKDLLGEDKVNQIRVYSGEKFELLQEAEKGIVCAVTGLQQTKAGEGLGAEQEAEIPVLEPVLTYRVQYPETVDSHKMLENLRCLEEEDPMLRVFWEEELGELQLQLMGEVQLEILQSVIKDRFDIEVAFDSGNIVYKETIAKPVEGVGHFEPLRHYAEVHLILEPGEKGSGMQFAVDCSEDDLDKNWQRLVYTHLVEKEHRGVLTGAALTDMKITLVGGKAHQKHTEGGDFRQSTYRAIRQGLMQAESVLLEPYYDFTLEIPSECVGRAMTDLQRMGGTFQVPENSGDTAVLTGTAPVSEIRDYPAEVISYSKGKGQLTCVFRGYEACHNAQEVIEEIGYEAERDLENPSASVFCSHGAGVVIPWNEVFDHMHVESQFNRYFGIIKEVKEPVIPAPKNGRSSGNLQGGGWNPTEEKELEEIFIRTYGKYEHKTISSKVVTTPEYKKPKKPDLMEILLVDGYNVIFAWEDLKDLANENIESARGRLMDILSNYQGFKKCNVILVFDAYLVDGEDMKVMKYHNIHVVYTKEAETADQYIEKVVHEVGRKYQVTVVTSDAVEQVVIRGQGASLISSREFREEVDIVNRQIMEEARLHKTESGKRYLFDDVEEEFARKVDDVRMGKANMEENE